MSAAAPIHDAIVLKTGDQVATALRHIGKGEIVTIKSAGKIQELEIREEIPICHKFAIRDIATGDEVRKYGETIGKASQDIPAGCHVHIHNLRSLRAVIGVIHDTVVPAGLPH